MDEAKLVKLQVAKAMMKVEETQVAQVMAKKGRDGNKRDR